MGFLQLMEFLSPPPLIVAPPSWKTRLRRWLLRRAWNTARRSVRLVWRWTRALAPWYAAVIVWLAAALFGLDGQGWKTLAAIAAAGAAPMYWWLGGWSWRFTRRRRLRPAGQRCWYAAFYLLLAVWAPVAAAWTVGPPWAGVLWVGTLAVWVRWLWQHRTRVEPAAPVVVGEREAAWARVKGLGGTALGNVQALTDPKRWEADVDLGDTDLLVRDVVAAAPYIAKRFKQPLGNIVVEYGRGQLEHVAKLTVVEENPCHDAVVYDESWIPTERDAGDGCVPFHLYPNGMRARVRLWLPGAGTVNSLFSGDIRTGKSAGMEAKMTQAVWTGMVWPMAADPQGGVSMPTWCAREGRGLARWQATELDGIFRQLCAFRDGMFARSAAMSQFRWVDRWGDEQVGINCWDPRIPGMPPAVGWSCDEFWMLMKIPEFAEVFKECMKMMNKTGMFMDIATQYPGIEEFNNDMAMRQPLTAGNLLSYRNTATSVKEMILPAGMPSPLHIPWETPEGEHTKGTLIAVSQAPKSSLPVYSRSVWVERGRYWAAKAMQRCPELDDVTAAAFAKWMTSAASVAEAERERVTVTAGTAKRERALDRILAYLAEREDRRAHTTVIAEALDMPKSTVSQTMKRAVESGSVRQVREGVWATAEPAEAATVAA